MKKYVLICMLALPLSAIASVVSTNPQIIHSDFPIVPFVDRGVLSKSNQSYSIENGRGQLITDTSILVEGMAMEWLPLDFASNYSYNEIINLTKPGEKYDEWRLANSTDINTLVSLFMGTQIDYDLTFDEPNRNYIVPEREGAADAFIPFFRSPFGIVVLESNPTFYESLDYDETEWYSQGQFNDDLNITGFSTSFSAPALTISQSSTARGSGTIRLDGQGDAITLMTFGGRDQKQPSISSFLVKDFAVVSTPSSLFLITLSLFVIFYRFKSKTIN